MGRVLPTRLEEARVSLHWAAQLVSAPGTTLLPPDPEHVRTNLAWDARLGLLAGRNVGTPRRRAGLVFEALELVVLEGDRERASMALAGHTLEDALEWLGAEIGGDATGLRLPKHQMPSHPAGDGSVFADAAPEARTELAAWFADGSSTLIEALSDEPEASPVRCWPHHFDVASLISLDPGTPGTNARTIGVGLSPGDCSYDQPYFYVTPWPYPSPSSLPELEGGAQWHTEGWTGAVLTGERVVASGEDEQHSTVRRAIDEALAACHALLGA